MVVMVSRCKRDDSGVSGDGGGVVKARSLSTSSIGGSDMDGSSRIDILAVIRCTGGTESAGGQLDPPRDPHRPPPAPPLDQTQEHILVNPGKWWAEQGTLAQEQSPVGEVIAAPRGQ
ncbi:hypothetical protein Tco_0185507, partial [Tanacetum coccineum]